MIIIFPNNDHHEAHLSEVSNNDHSLERGHLPDIFPPLEEAFELRRLSIVDHSGHFLIIIVFYYYLSPVDHSGQ